MKYHCGLYFQKNKSDFISFPLEVELGNITKEIRKYYTS